MFVQGSRYYRLENATYVNKQGNKIIYKRRRLIKKGEDIPRMGEATLRPNERLDLLTHRVLGDPEHFWRICDINNAIEPGELTLVPGRVLYVPIPTPD